MPDVRLAPVALLTTGSPVRATAAASNRVVVVLPFVADTSATRCPAASCASAFGAIALITRPLIVAPCAAPGDAGEPPGDAPAGDRDARAQRPSAHRALAPVRIDAVRDARAPSVPASSGWWVEHVAHLVEDPLPLGRRQHGDVADRRDAVDDARRA